jgi:hypothetical protein
LSACGFGDLSPSVPQSLVLPGWWWLEPDVSEPERPALFAHDGALITRGAPAAAVGGAGRASGSGGSGSDGPPGGGDGPRGGPGDLFARWDGGGSRSSPGAVEPPGHRAGRSAPAAGHPCARGWGPSRGGARCGPGAGASPAAPRSAGQCHRACRPVHRPGRSGLHLAPHRPVYGLQAMGIDATSERHRSVEATAEHYANLIDEHWPEGVVHLLGQSAAGWYTLAVASELRRRGRSLGLVAILDSGQRRPSQDDCGDSCCCATAFGVFPCMPTSSGIASGPAISWPAGARASLDLQA